MELGWTCLAVGAGAGVGEAFSFGHDEGKVE